MCPLVKIELIEGKSVEYKNAVLKGVHQALVSAIGAPSSEILKTLYELPFNNFEYPPDKTVNTTIIEIRMFKGRTLKQKRELYQAIVYNLKKDPGIDGNDVTIVILEPDLENWGMRGGKVATEIEF